MCNHPVIGSETQFKLFGDSLPQPVFALWATTGSFRCFAAMPGLVPWRDSHSTANILRKQDYYIGTEIYTVNHTPTTSAFNWTRTTTPR